MTTWLRRLFNLPASPTALNNYNQWSKSELIAKIQSMEKTQLNKPSPTKVTRPFDITKYKQRRIALKVAYLGWNYSGFTIQKRNDVSTVEDKLFKVLQECKLITSPEDCEFSRCGRTDKGVSGLGQVVALNIRSSKHTYEDDNSEEDLPYLEIINRLLPHDIRVLAWAPVGKDFNARYNCKSRTYKYFFQKDVLDLELMRKAASYLCGTHDFRNFCRLDPSKNIKNYKRTIISLDINPVIEEKGFYEVHLKGSSFLWHQVRYIMSILFLVGQKLESPEIARELLDINKLPAKPGYPMADDLPLMLYDCEFENVDWIYYTQSKTHPQLIPSALRTYQHLHEAWSSYMIKGLLYETCMDQINTIPLPLEDGSYTTNMVQYVQQLKTTDTTVVIGGGRRHKVDKYVPILSRPRGDSDEVKKEKYKLRKQTKVNRAHPQQS